MVDVLDTHNMIICVSNELICIYDNISHYKGIGKETLMFCPQRFVNYQNLMIQFYALLLILESDFSLRRALQIQICVVEPCCRHVKHSLNSKKYASEKIMVIRCIKPNVKQENSI